MTSWSIILLQVFVWFTEKCVKSLRPDNFIIFSFTSCIYIRPVQFSSVPQSSPTVCDPMDYSMPGFPVHHQLLELAQTHVHQVGNAIQPSHPLSSPSPPAFNLPSIRVFSNESVLCIMWPKYWNFSFSISPSIEYSGLISFRMDWFDLFAVQGTLTNTIVQKHQFFGAQLFL